MEIQVHIEEPDTARGRLPQPSGASRETVLAKGMTVLGNLYGGGTLWVEGAVKGSIDITGIVIVTTGGMVKGSIHADTVYVAGYVEGSIFAENLLRLEMTGDIYGNVTTASFLIHDGGQLNGYCTMTTAGQEPLFLY